MLQVKSCILSNSSEMLDSLVSKNTQAWDLFPSPLASVMEPALRTTEALSGPSVASAMYTAATWDSQLFLVLLMFCSQQKLGLPELKVSLLSPSVGPAAAKRFALCPELE